MKNEKKTTPNRQRRFLKIIVPIALIVIMGINCFASPGYDSSTSSYSNDTVPDSGFIDIQTIDYSGYYVNHFVLGTASRNMYNFDGVNISSPTVNGVNQTYTYNFTRTISGVRLHMPVAFFPISSGQIVPNAFAEITFNVDVYMFVEFDVVELDSDGNIHLVRIVQDRYISANSPLIWLEGIPSGTQTVVNYKALISFSVNPSNLVMKYTDSFTQSYKNKVVTLVANNNYQSGYNEGVNAGTDIGYKKGYVDGKNYGLSAGPLSQFSYFLTTTVGGFLDAPLFGEGSFTIGHILILFVGFSIVIWLLKLLAGG